MVKAVRVHSVGGTHTIQFEDIRIPAPPESHVEIRHTLIVASDYDRQAMAGRRLRGYYNASSAMKYPFTMGLSAVGVITEVGSGVLDWQIGQRVGYVNAPEAGSFSEQSVIPVKNLFLLPDFLTDEQAATVLFEGLVAWMLVRKVFPVRRGDRVLIHEIESGLGSLLCQWARHLGATVIGTVLSEAETTPEKETKIASNHVISYSNFAQTVLEITDGSGADVVFDAVGGDNITGSFDCLASRGMLVVVAGKLPSFSFSELAEKGTSISISFPILQDFIERREDLLAASTELFSLLKSHTLSFPLKEKYPLQTAAQALEDLKRQEVLGSFILVPPIPDPKDVPNGS